MTINAHVEAEYVEMLRDQLKRAASKLAGRGFSYEEIVGLVDEMVPSDLPEEREVPSITDQERTFADDLGKAVYRAAGSRHEVAGDGPEASERGCFFLVKLHSRQGATRRLARVSVSLLEERA